MKKKILLDRINQSIQLAHELHKVRYDEKDDDRSRMLYSRWYSQTTTCLIDIFNEDHHYTKEFIKTCGFIGFPSINEGIGILTAVKEDIEKGYINNLFGLISAEIFSDVLDMAKHFLDEKYKDPSAIIIGIALEAHLKGLSKKHGIDLEYLDSKGNTIPKKASVLNSELSKINAYNKLDEKLVTAWLDLRNKAAHGKFSEYTFEHVENMLQSVTQFINRTT